MTTDERLEGLIKLGEYINAIDEEELDALIARVQNENPWFTPGSVDTALTGIRRYLDPQKLKQWISSYRLEPGVTRTVAVVMAGNIPLAGFHDTISVLISGHALMAKLSSKDSVLPKFLIDKLIELEPQFGPLISLPERLKGFDAVIATGSDNSARYFNYYFGKYPHIIRQNRSSCAILTGQETDDELVLLGRDVFTYFGLGCRNVSKIFIPSDYDPVKLISAWDIYVDIIHHHKYHNNYDYQKSILLVNKIPFYDSGFVILQEHENLVSPVSVVYLERYNDPASLHTRLSAFADKLQCIVGKSAPDHVPFGQTQFPELWDYADRVDTIRFLETLS